MRDHLQQDELSRAIVAFLGDPDQFHLIVHEPETAQQVDFIRWYSGEPVLRLSLALTATDERDRASSLGFADDRGLPQMIFRLSGDPTEAREVCVAALLFVLQIDPLAWLWITPVWEYDAWPVPLPKPVPWPPAAG